jgi:hypothetical protein
VVDTVLNPQARIDAFQLNIITDNFRTAGLVPLDLELVLSKLNIQLRTPIPLASRGSLSKACNPHTPATVDELYKQVSSIKAPFKTLKKSAITVTGCVKPVYQRLSDRNAKGYTSRARRPRGYVPQTLHNGKSVLVGQDE